MADIGRSSAISPTLTAWATRRYASCFREVTAWTRCPPYGAASPRPRRNRQILPRAPFRPRAVIERSRLFADGVEPEPQDRGGHARTAACYGRLVEVDPAGRKRFPQLVRRQQQAVFHD